MLDQQTTTSPPRRVQRAFWPQYNSEEKLARLLEWVLRYPGLCDGVSLFTEGDGCDWRWYDSVEVRRRAAWIREAVQRIRQSGLHAHVNILNTLGHSDDGGPGAPIPPFRKIVALDGAAAAICGCPSDPVLCDDIKNKYAEFSRSGADVFWIDDDLRHSGHHPVLWGCFCDACVEGFSQSTKEKWDRPRLAKALGDDKNLRRAWRKWSGDLLHTLLSCCVEGIRTHAPKAEIGLMTGDIINLQDSETDFGNWLEEARGPGKWWLRPGPGFWKDDRPLDLLEKLHGVANTLDQVQGPHRATLYEVENYPFTPGSKSAAQTGAEVTLALLTTGCEGVMFDLLDMSGNPPDWTSSWWDKLNVWPAIWEEADRFTRGMRPIGWRPAFSPEHFIHRPPTRTPHENRHPKFYKQVASALLSAGLPVTADSPGALGSALAGEVAEGMSRQELEQLLEKPLILDGKAAKVLLDRGLGALFGLEEARPHIAGVYEKFTGHPLNGEFDNANRAMTLAYTESTSWAIKPAPGRTEILSHLLDYHGDVLGCSCVLIDGGERAPRLVIGHLPWDWHLAPARLHQLRAVSNQMLSAYNLPWICGGDPVRTWLLGNSRDSIYRHVLYNASFDEAHVTFSSSFLPRPLMRVGGTGSLDKELQLHATLSPWEIAVIEWTSPESD